MATLRQEQWLGAGAGSFLTGVSDLALAGSGDAVRLYSASRFATVTGGLSAFAVGGDGQLTGPNALALPTVPQSYGPTRLALVPGWPSGGLRSAPAGTAVLADGQLDKRMTALQGGLAPDLVAVQALDLGGTAVVFGLCASTPQPQAWTVQGSGALSAAAAPVPGAAPPGPPGGPPATLFAATALGPGSGARNTQSP
ncbi:MAG: hypothetical protein Q8K20_13680 [Gemmobacter sp.]|nr:hypothetical protein [Gemmobacter sp.]